MKNITANRRYVPWRRGAAILDFWRGYCWTSWIDGVVESHNTKVGQVRRTIGRAAATNESQHFGEKDKMAAAEGRGQRPGGRVITQHWCAGRLAPMTARSSSSDGSIDFMTRWRS